jgi:hypothetical protein
MFNTSKRLTRKSWYKLLDSCSFVSSSALVHSRVVLSKGTRDERKRISATSPMPGMGEDGENCIGSSLVPFDSTTRHCTSEKKMLPMAKNVLGGGAQPDYDLFRTSSASNVHVPYHC